MEPWCPWDPRGPRGPIGPGSLGTHGALGTHGPLGTQEPLGTHESRGIHGPLGTQRGPIWTDNLDMVTFPIGRCQGMPGNLEGSRWTSRETLST